MTFPANPDTASLTDWLFAAGDAVAQEEVAIAREVARRFGIRISADVSGIGAVASIVLDQTGAPNTAIDTGAGATALDTSKFSSMMLGWFCSGGTSAITMQILSDDGTAQIATAVTAAAALSGSILWGTGVTGGTTNFGFVPRRVRVQASSPGVGNTVRVVLQGRRAQ